MLKKMLFIGAVASLVSGCVAAPMKDPVEDFVIPGDYQAIAECVFEQTRAGLKGVNLVSLPSTNAAEVFQEYDNVRAWELRLTKSGARATRVVAKAFPSVWAKGFNSRQAVAAARSCSSG